MASPFAAFNDAVLKPEKVEDKFRELFPRDKVIYTSSGFIVPRIFKGDRKQLGFPAYGNHHLGALVVSNKRLFFWNQRKSPYDIMMKIIWGVVIALLIPVILMLAVIIILIPDAKFVLIPILPSAIILFGVVPLLLHQHKEVMMEKRLSDAKAVRLNTMKTFWIKYDMIDFYDGEKTVHFAPYHPYNEDVVSMILALKVGEVY
jgi:hypothetical protein